MNQPGYTRFDSEAGYRAAIDAVLALAHGEIRLFDHDLGKTGLDGKDQAKALDRHLASGGSLHIVVHATQRLLDMPRLLDLLERRADAMQVRISPDALKHLADGQVLVDGLHAVRRFHRDHPRGAIELDVPAEIRPWWLRFEELWEQSLPWSPPRL